MHHAPGARGTVLVVSYLARPENDEAVRWVLSDVWHRVLARYPYAKLRLVGKGASTALKEQAASMRSVEVVGFVDELEEEYRRASMVLVPVRRGAGVKFKTVEGLLHGVPVVTTSVGAEGIEGPSLFVECSDSAKEIASAVIRVLDDPGAYQTEADRAQQWAWSLYSLEAFAVRLRTNWPNARS